MQPPESKSQPKATRSLGVNYEQAADGNYCQLLLMRNEPFQSFPFLLVLLVPSPLPLFAGLFQSFAFGRRAFREFGRPLCRFANELLHAPRLPLVSMDI